MLSRGQGDDEAPLARLAATVLLALLCGACSAPEPSQGSQSQWYGVVEGFYGEPYTFEQRSGLIEFLSDVGANTYLYAPKNDPYHRERWREPYPAAELTQFEDLAALGKARGVRFVFGISPGGSYDPATGDLDTLLSKLARIYDTGVRDFCVLFDDVAGGSPGAEPALQVSVLTSVWDALQEQGDDTSLCFVPNYYFGTAQQLREDQPPPQLFGYPEPPSAYYAAYEAIPAEVAIMWTGRRVTPSTIEASEVRDFQAFVGRRVLIWDNALANDLVLGNELFLGPYLGRTPELAEAADGILINPMRQAEASKIMLFTAAKVFEGGAYDPWGALEESIAFASRGGGGEALTRLIEHFESHPFIGENTESERLAQAMDAFVAGTSPSTEAALRAELVALEANHDALTTALANEALRTELEEPSAKLSLLAVAALTALDEWAVQESGGTADRASVVSAIEAAQQIPWLAGADTPISDPISEFLSDRPSKKTDVFGAFFDEMLRWIEQ